MDPDSRTKSAFVDIGGPVSVKPVDLVGSLPRHPTKRYSLRCLADITKIVVHTTNWDCTPDQLAKYDITPLFTVKGKRVYNHISRTGCLTPGSRILTVDGYRNIEDIQVGDYVIGPTTHEAVMVTDVHQRDINENVYELHFALENSGPVTATHEHPFLVWRAPVCNAPQNKHFCTSYACKTMSYHKNRLTRRPVCAGDDISPENIIDQLQWIPAAELKEGDFSALYLGGIGQRAPWSNDLLYICGWYLAEGWYNKKTGVVSLAFNALEEMHYLEEVAAIANAHGYATRYRIRDSVAELSISRKFFVEILQWILGGDRVHNKFVRENFMKAPIDQQLAFLEGYIRGDGSETDRDVRVTIVSEVLAHQMFILFARQGHIPSKLKRRPERQTLIQGRKVSCHQEWVVSYRKDPTYSLGFIAENYLLFPIKKINPVAYQGPICNLTVDKEEAYIVNSVSTHNCPSITYHEGVVGEEGQLVKTLNWREISWHAGRHNKSSLGIALYYKCQEDGVDVHAPSKRQMQTLWCRCGHICLQLGLGPEAVVGHRELKGTGWFWEKGSRRLRKTCPGLLVNMDVVRINVAKYMQCILRAKELYMGEIDGDFGPLSRRALEGWK